MTKKAQKPQRKPPQVGVTVYFDSPEEVELIKRAAAKVQGRTRPSMSPYIAFAAKQKAATDLERAGLEAK